MEKDSKERKGLVAGATIVMFILIVVMIIVNRPKILTQQELAAEQTGKENILLLLKENFFKLNQGVYENNLIYGNDDSLKVYLTSLNVLKEPHFFNFKDWKAIACFITENSGYELINYLYKSDNLTLYIFQIPVSLIDTQTLKLSKNLLGFLNMGNCFLSRENDNIYILRKIDNEIFGFASKSLNRDTILNICQ